MPARDLPARPSIEQYKKQAKDLLKSCKSRDAEALRRIREFVRQADGPSRSGTITLADAQFVIAREHGFNSWPNFAKEITTRTGIGTTGAVWKAAEETVVAGNVSSLARLLREHEQMFRSQRPQSSWLGGLTPDYSAADARSIIVRNHGFENWDQFAAYADAAKNPTSPVARFEAAVDAIVAGDVEGLQRLLRQDPDLVRARSPRTHHSTLLHYVGANGVEGFRQRTPKSAVQIAETLLNAGAEVDAGADMYEGGCTTLGLVATSIHPIVAGLLQPLIDTLIAHGARIDVPGSGRGHLLVNGCLANGRPEGAELLASRGAPLDLEAAAGLGRLDLVKLFFDEDGRLKSTATMTQMKDGMAWACEYGRTEVIGFLLDHGIGVDERLRPHGQTGLHWAAHGGYVDAVRVLLTRHAPVDVKDESFDGTPLGWALHGFTEAAKDSYYQVVALLVAAGAPVQPEWLSDENARTNPRMILALTGKTRDAKARSHAGERGSSDTIRGRPMNRIRRTGALRQPSRSPASAHRRRERMKKAKSGARRSGSNRSGAPETVDDYLARVPEPARSTLEKTRAAIRSVVPRDTTETISYRMPAFRHNVVLVWYAAFADHVSLFPTARVIEAFRDELAEFKTSKGTIHFPTDKPLPIALIKRIVKARVAQVKSRKGR
jgi:uncharacterized protein YdhG (YjbR/CyaY superfamily)